jgi:hypothetical protein
MAKSDPIWEIRPTYLDSNLTWFDFFRKSNWSEFVSTQTRTTQNPRWPEIRQLKIRLDLNPNDPKLEMTRDQAIWSPTWSKPEWPKIQDDLRSNDPKPNLIRTRITRSMPERPKIWDYPRLENPKFDLIRLVLHIYIYNYFEIMPYKY